MKTFANLPVKVEQAIMDILAQQDSDDWVQHAITLHEQYLSRTSGFGRVTLRSVHDVLAYLALRAPATYAQIYSSLTQIQELLPSWQPTKILDLGTGPGTGSWAAKAIWSSIAESISVDEHKEFLRVGKQIENNANLDMDMHWLQADLQKGLPEQLETYDIIIIANVLNELNPKAADKLIGQAFDLCQGILVIIEPGTPAGSSIIENASRKLSKAGNLLAPYIQNTFISKTDYYIHFSQRFIRPEFQRRIRQHMRDTSLMASDWEDTKYAYTIISKLNPEVIPWGRCIGQVHIQKGFLEVPILTKDGIQKVKVMKRNYDQYTFAKDLKWGQLIMRKMDLITE